MPNLENFEITAKQRMIDRRINAARRKYEIKKNILFSILKNDYSKRDLVEKEFIKLNKRYVNCLIKANSLAIDVEYGLDHIKLEDEKKKLTESSKELQSSTNKLNQTKKREKKYKMYLPIIVSSALALSSIGYVFCLHKAKENLIDESTKVYKDELEKVVDESTHEIYDFESDEMITYIDYSDIADYIESCDDPDLALFTLYRNYGRSKTSYYENITNRTCEELDFEYNGEDIKGNFKDYITYNGYDTYNNYYKDSKQAIINDYMGEEEGLDNIKNIKVKKLVIKKDDNQID